MMPHQLSSLKELYGLSGAREMFELLVTRLVQAERPGARTIRVSRGDGGIDTFWGEFNAESIHVWQSKYFLDGLTASRRQQIKKSFETARKNPRFSLGAWTLVVACDLSQEEQVWFENWSSEYPDILMDYWNGDEVVRRLHLQENENVRVEFFASDTERRIRELHDAVCRKRTAVPWEDIRRALLAELDDMAAVVRGVLTASANADVNVDWGTRVWRTRKREIERALGAREWWPDVTEVYEQWRKLAERMPTGSDFAGGAERGAVAALRHQECVPHAAQLLEELAGVREELLQEARAGIAANEVQAFLAWREQRVKSIRRGSTPQPLLDGVLCVVHLASAASFGSGVEINLVDAEDVVPSPGLGGSSPVYDVDSVAKVGAGGGPTDVYIQLFDNGVAELVEVGPGGPSLRGLEDRIVAAVRRMAEIPTQLNLNGPFLVSFVVLGTRGATIWINEFTYKWRGRPIQRESLSPPPEIVDSLEDIESLLRPSLDWVWRAAGYKQCHRYGPGGRWREQW